MRLVDFLIASLDRGPFDQTRVRVAGIPGRALVHVDEWCREQVRGPWRKKVPLLCLTADEALSLAAFLQRAAAALKQEGG